MEKNNDFNLSKNVDMSPIDIAKLSDKEQADIESIKTNISFEHETIAQYAKDATNRLTDFSAQILNTVKVKDAPEVEDMLLSLVGELNKFNTEELAEKKKGFFDRFKKDNRLQDFMTKYKTVSDVISDTKAKLEEAEYQLRKDIKTSEMYLEINREYIADLEKYILAGEMRIEEEHAEIEKERIGIDAGDMLAVNELSVKESNLKALERKIYNLRLQRMIAIQNIPQLMLIKDGDAVLVQKIDDSINQTIPLWHSQIAIGIQIMRQQTGVKISKAVTDTTNRLLERNAELLKQSAVGVATENERDIVEIDTIKKANTALIETLNSIREIRKQGSEKRQQSIYELSQLQSALNTAMIESYA